MNGLKVLIVASIAALALGGCVGYGPHGGWSGHGSHMNGYRGDGYRMHDDPPPPCTEEQRQSGYPCRQAP